MKRALDQCLLALAALTWPQLDSSKPRIRLRKLERPFTVIADVEVDVNVDVDVDVVIRQKSFCAVDVVSNGIAHTFRFVDD